MMAYKTNLKRVMLIFPPSTSLSTWEPMVSLPMGISYLASSLREAGFEVTCLDAVVEAPYQETPVSEHISRFGLTYDEIVSRVAEVQPEVVGISCIFSNQWPAVRELSRRLKKEFPDLILATGGAHPTFLSALCMRDAPLDFILRGEAEESFVTLLTRLSQGQSFQDVDGLVYREGEDIRVNPKVNFIADLDRLPFPAHDLLDPERYFKIALPMAYSFLSPRNLPVVTSRGCPCQCTFCSSTQFWGRRYRTRSAENVLAELDWLVNRFQIKEIKVQDDNLTVNRERAKKIFQGMIERPYTLNWNTPNGIAVWTLDEEMLSLMKRSGCYEICMAIESGDQEVLNKIVKKPLKLDKVREVNRLAKKQGLVRAAYFIIGFPGETKAQIMNTVRLARELKLHTWAIFIYNPLPGSQLFEECVRRGYITEESFFEEGNQYFSSVIDSEEWTAKELEALIRREWIRTYFSIFHSPYLTGRRYVKFLQYRPSFLKFFLLRTLRAIKLQWQDRSRPLPTTGG